MTLKQATVESSARCSNRCTELIAVMHEQERLCARLLELSRGEREAMLAGSLDLLENVTRDKNDLIAEMDRLEQKRRGVAVQLAREVGLPTEISLLALAARVGGNEAEELLDTRHRVAQSVARLRETNEGNIQLMRKSLETVRDSIRQLRRATGTGNTYTWSGQPRLSAAGTLAVDCHA